MEGYNKSGCKVVSAGSAAGPVLWLRTRVLETRVGNPNANHQIRNSIQRFRLMVAPRKALTSWTEVQICKLRCTTKNLGHVLCNRIRPASEDVSRRVRAIRAWHQSGKAVEEILFMLQQIRTYLDRTLTRLLVASTCRIS